MTKSLEIDGLKNNVAYCPCPIVEMVRRLIRPLRELDKKIDVDARKANDRVTKARRKNA